MHNAQFFVTLCFVRHVMKDFISYISCIVSKYLEL